MRYRFLFLLVHHIQKGAYSSTSHKAVLIAGWASSADAVSSTSHRGHSGRGPSSFDRWRVWFRQVDDHLSQALLWPGRALQLDQTGGNGRLTGRLPVFSITFFPILSENKTFWIFKVFFNLKQPWRKFEAGNVKRTIKLNWFKVSSYLVILQLLVTSWHVVA